MPKMRTGSNGGPDWREGTIFTGPDSPQSCSSRGTGIPNVPDKRDCEWVIRNQDILSVEDGGEGQAGRRTEEEPPK